MKIVHLGTKHSIINQYIAEIRDIDVQTNRSCFRHNLNRIGQLMAYELSRTLDFSEKSIQTPLSVTNVETPDDQIVLGTVLRAGLAFHQGFLDIFDKADSAFVSAYRSYRDTTHRDVKIHIEYIAAPDLENKTFILVDPMLATGGSIELAYKAFITKGTPKKLHICSAIAAQPGVEYLQKAFPDDDVILWCAAIDPMLDEHAYIVPGLGDAGDLAYGEKL